MNEIRTEYLKALQAVGLSWLTCLFNTALEVEDSGSGLADWGGGFPFFKKGTGGLLELYGISLLNHSGKVCDCTGEESSSIN